ncbi:MAG: hypothetical protein KA253_04505 [Campylobacteraceae bacterium]|nr:hypothetical protein [Campylobacteraceae bacterium]
MSDYQCGLPCDATKLVKFRNRIGQSGVDAIFGASVALHPEASQEETQSTQCYETFTHHCRNINA